MCRSALLWLKKKELILINNLKLFTSREKFLTCLALLGLLGIIYYSVFFTIYGCLPEPFLYDKSDTFMDFYNPLYWTFEPSRYETWKSIYPPLNFLILKIFTFVISDEFQFTAKSIREKYGQIILIFFIFYLILPLILFKSKDWSIFSYKDKFLLYFVVIFSTPMLFALERGNLILITLPLLSLVFCESKLIRIVSIAILVNIKPYLWLFSFFYIVRKKWKDFIVLSTFSGFIFVITGLLLGGNFFTFFYNIIDYAGNSNLYSIREVLAMPSSISALSSALEYISSNYYIKLNYINSLNFITPEALILISILCKIVKLSSLFFALTVLFRREAVLEDWQIIVLIIALITNLGLFTGGYSMIFYVVCIPYFMRMKFKNVYIIIISLMSAPLDLISIYHALSVDYIWSYLGSGEIYYQWCMSLGALARPILNLSLLIILAIEFFGSSNHKMPSYKS